MRYVDAQSYVTNYWREIKDKSEFEQIDNDKILEWNNKSLKRKDSLLSYWENSKKTNKNTAESNSTRNSRLLVVVSASRVSGFLKNLSDPPSPIVVETVVNVQLNPFSCGTSNETEPILVKIDSKIVSLFLRNWKMLNLIFKKTELSFGQRKKKFVRKLKRLKLN